MTRAHRTSGLVREEARNLAIRTRAGVVVAGAGLGGVAAALAAARAGADTVLVERNGFAGGTATAGMCCSVFNCLFTRSGRPAVFGLPVEITDAFAAASGYGRNWRNHKGHIIYDLEQAKRVLDRLLADAGVRVLYQAWTSGVVMDENRVCGVVVETTEGREAILADAVVDATGDARLAAAAGAPVRTRPNSLHSLCFRLGNVDVDTFANYFRADPQRYPAYMDVEWSAAEALAQYDECGTFLFPHGGGIQLDCFRRARADGAIPERLGVMDSLDACQMHALRSTRVVHVITGFARFDGLDPERIARSMLDGRRMAELMTDVFRRYVPGFTDCFLAGTADNLGVRASRWIEGRFDFRPEMMQPGVRQRDAVGTGVGWDNVVVHPGRGAWGAQRLRADTFDIPWRCLLPREVDGLIMGAGRSVSATPPDLLRTMVQTMTVGQAAGAGAAAAVLSGTTPAAVPPAAIQEVLREQGVPVGS